MLRLQILAVVLFAFIANAGELSEKRFTSRVFLACDESIDLSCSELSTPLTLERDFTVQTEHDELKGTWRLLGNDRIRIGRRDFVFLRDQNVFVSSLDEKLVFGIALVEDSRTGRRSLKAREHQFESVDKRREVAHLYLRSRSRIHDTCITLTDIGDESSVELLVGVLPDRPTTEGEPGVEYGVECTFAHCAAALSRITGKTCGVYREDWQSCLAKSAPDSAVPPPPTAAHSP